MERIGDNMDFNEARAYLQETKLQFTKTMAKEMKEALEKADIALALAVIVVEQNGISNADLEEIIRNDEEVKMQKKIGGYADMGEQQK